MILSDDEIYDECLWSSNNMIEPFLPMQIAGGDNGKRVISYGLSSYGYDARVGRDFKVLNSANLDPKAPEEHAFQPLLARSDGSVWLPPNSHTLCHTVERFKMPEDVLAICLGKSTYARCGVIVNCTPLEPGWEGQVTLELSNTSSVSVRVYPGEGICQFIFLRGSPCDVSYADRNGGTGGKYQSQSGVVLPRL